MLTLCLTTDVQVGGLENRWIMDSGCSRHMTGNDKWFFSLTPMRSKEYIVFGDNGRGKVRGLGAVRVSDRFTLREIALVSNLDFNLLSVSNFLMRGLRFASKRAVRVFWIPGEIWFARLHLAIGFSWLTSLELLLALLVACWLVLLLICGSGIGDLDI